MFLVIVLMTNCFLSFVSIPYHKKSNLHLISSSESSFVPAPRGIAYTTKIPGTAHTLRCCVAHNPYNNEMCLYAGRANGVLLLQWYEPLQKFMIVKDIDCTLPSQLDLFEPIVKKVKIPKITWGHILYRKLMGWICFN